METNQTVISLAAHVYAQLVYFERTFSSLQGVLIGLPSHPFVGVHVVPIPSTDVREPLAHIVSSFNSIYEKSTLAPSKDKEEIKGTNEVVEHKESEKDEKEKDKTEEEDKSVSKDGCSIIAYFVLRDAEKEIIQEISEYVQGTRPQTLICLQVLQKGVINAFLEPSGERIDVRIIPTLQAMSADVIRENLRLSIPHSSSQRLSPALDMDQFCRMHEACKVVLEDWKAWNRMSTHERVEHVDAMLSFVDMWDSLKGSATSFFPFFLRVLDALCEMSDFWSMIHSVISVPVKQPADFLLKALKCIRRLLQSQRILWRHRSSCGSTGAEIFGRIQNISHNLRLSTPLIERLRYHCDSKEPSSETPLQTRMIQKECFESLYCLCEFHFEVRKSVFSSLRFIPTWDLIRILGHFCTIYGSPEEAMYLLRFIRVEDDDDVGVLPTKSDEDRISRLSVLSKLLPAAMRKQGMAVDVMDRQSSQLTLCRRHIPWVLRLISGEGDISQRSSTNDDHETSKSSGASSPQLVSMEADLKELSLVLLCDVLRQVDSAHMIVFDSELNPLPILRAAMTQALKRVDMRTLHHLCEIFVMSCTRNKPQILESGLVEIFSELKNWDHAILSYRVHFTFNLIRMNHIPTPKLVENMFSALSEIRVVDRSMHAQVDIRLLETALWGIERCMRLLYRMGRKEIAGPILRVPFIQKLLGCAILIEHSHDAEIVLHRRELVERFTAIGNLWLTMMENGMCLDSSSKEEMRSIVGVMQMQLGGSHTVIQQIVGHKRSRLDTPSSEIGDAGAFGSLADSEGSPAKRSKQAFEDIGPDDIQFLVRFGAQSRHLVSSDWTSLTYETFLSRIERLCGIPGASKSDKFNSDIDVFARNAILNQITPVISDDTLYEVLHAHMMSPPPRPDLDLLVSLRPRKVGMNRDVWSEEEEKSLVEGIRMYGFDWKKLRDHIGRRSVVSVRHHTLDVISRIDDAETTDSSPPPVPGMPGECLVNGGQDGSESNGPSDSSSLEDEPTGASQIESIMRRVSEESDCLREGDRDEGGGDGEEENGEEKERRSAEKIQDVEGVRSSSSVEALGKHVSQDVHSKVLL